MLHVRNWHIATEAKALNLRRYSGEQRTSTRTIGRTTTRMPSRPGEFHPEPLTDPDLILSHHPARAIARRLPPSIEHRVPPVAG